MLARIIAATAICLSSAHAIGCGRGAIKGTPYAAHYVETFWGTPCHTLVADEPSQWAWKAMCPDRLNPTTPLYDSQPWPARIEPAQAAALVSICAATLCNPAYEDPHLWAQHVSLYDPRYLAVMWDLAMRTSPEDVKAALAGGDLGDKFRAAFVARYEAARARIRATVDQLGDHWRDVMIRPALGARAGRVAADEALADWRIRLADLKIEADRAILAGAPDDTWLEAALSLRREYVGACLPVRGELLVCLADDVGHGAAMLIAQLAAASGDPALVAAEGVFRVLPRRDDARTDEHLAATAALTDERDRRAAYDAAVAAGLDDRAIAERWPEPPIAPPADTLFGVAPSDQPFEPERVTRFYPSGAEVVVEEIRSVKRKGKRAVLQFRKDVTVNYEATGCRETNRVEAIADNGELIYRVNCTGPDRKYTIDNTKKPVEVPWTEVARVKKGETVQLAIDKDTRKGHLVWAARTGKRAETWSQPALTFVQLREFRLASASERIQRR